MLMLFTILSHVLIEQLFLSATSSTTIAKIVFHHFALDQLPMSYVLLLVDAWVLLVLLGLWLLGTNPVFAREEEPTKKHDGFIHFEPRSERMGVFMIGPTRANFHKLSSPSRYFMIFQQNLSLKESLFCKPTKLKISQQK